MQFGKKASEAPKMGSTPGESGGVRWMRTLKPGEYKMRFLSETDDWTFYWEHFNPTPGGFPFPCTGDKSTCPGCTSGIEKMEKASPKYAVNAKLGDYVDVYKFPVKFYNKMVIRSERNGGTVTDRDYLVTRIGNDTSTDYDIDMLMPSERPNVALHDIEAALAAAFEEAWPDFNPGETKSEGSRNGRKQDRTESSGEQSSGLDEFSKPEDQAKSDAAAGKSTEAGAGDEKEVSEADLRKMSPEDLHLLCKQEGVPLPTELQSTTEIVDWMIANL